MKRMRCSQRFCVVSLLLAGCPHPVPVTPSQPVKLGQHGETRTYEISEPDVTKDWLEFKDVVFRPGDTVEIDAEGCVQTGGVGDTWKRYVDPRGDHANERYFALIAIPGVIEKPERLSERVGCAFQIPSGIAGGATWLKLGYVDDAYGDNGYWGRDNGQKGQCAGVGNARVTVRVRHAINELAQEAGVFDLDRDAAPLKDPNGFPLNPRWYGEVHPENFHPTHPLPDAAAMCGNFKYMEPQSGPRTPPPGCTTTAVTRDIPTGVGRLLCDTTHPELPGHVNWEPVTYEGRLYFDELSLDYDYNFNLRTRCHAGVTARNLAATLDLEFDSRELIDGFHHPWWSALRESIATPQPTAGDNPTAGQLFNGKEAIVTGLLGLDCEHEGCAAELHPVYAMAIHLDDNPDDDTWAVFVRNFGTEGFCSQDRHDLQTNRLTFQLTKRDARFARLLPASSIYATNSSASWSVIAANNPIDHTPDAALASFDMGAGEANWMEGVLHLQWTAPNAAGGIPLPTVEPGALSSNHEKKGVEAQLAAALASVPEDQRKKFLSHPRTLKQDAPVSPTNPTTDPTTDTHLETEADSPPQVKTAPDEARIADDQRRMRDLCDFFQGSPPALFKESCALVKRN